MDDSDEEINPVKRSCRRCCFRIIDEDSEEDEKVDIEPSFETLPARTSDLLCNSGQTISRGGPTFCRYLYDAQAVNPIHVNHNPPMDTSSDDTSMATSGNVFYVEASRRPPNERPGLLYFYGNGIQLADTQTYSRPVHIALNGKLRGLMHFKTSGRSDYYHTHYRSISRYYDEMGMKITFGSLSIHEYKYILKHNWMLFVKEFENEFGQERIPLVLRRKIDRSRKLLNMTPVQWPLVHSVDQHGRLYQSETR